MPMNKAQVQHAVARIREAQREKEASIREEFGWKDVLLDVKDKWAKVKSGEAKLRKGTTPSIYDKWYTIYDFSQFEKSAGISKEGEKKLKEVSKAAEEAIDHIQLGDAQEALDIIKAFRGSD